MEGENTGNRYHYHVVGRSFELPELKLPADEGKFTVSVNVRVSRQFMGWVFSLGEQVKIIGPDSVVQLMKEEINRLVRQYST